MSKYQEKLEDVEGVISSLQKAKTVYEEVYSKVDKKVIKIKREIAVFLLKNEKYNEAIKELTETLVTLILLSNSKRKSSGSQAHRWVRP